MAITIGLALFFVASACQLTSRRGYELDRLRQEPATRVSYPGSINLRHEEIRPRSDSLEGLSYGPKIQDIFASTATAEAIEQFYVREMASLGWIFLGASSADIYTSKRLLFEKERLTAELQFWRKEPFLRTYPSLSDQAEPYSTIYRVFIIAPAN